jgi:hypothetical protein
MLNEIGITVAIRLNSIFGSGAGQELSPSKRACLFFVLADTTLGNYATRPPNSDVGFDG